MLKTLNNKKISGWWLICVMAVGLFQTASIGFAGDMEVKIKDIQKPAAQDIPLPKQEMKIEAPYYVTGTVEVVGDGWITVNDVQIRLAPGASMGCGVGDFVGVRVNDERQVISCESISRKKKQ